MMNRSDIPVCCTIAHLFRICPGSMRSVVEECISSQVNRDHFELSDWTCLTSELVTVYRVP